MTTEEKARAYDEALNWIHELHPRFPGAFKEEVEHYFPGLRESEDERNDRMRGRVIESLVCYRGKVYDEGDKEVALLVDEEIAWMKKQKEQKPEELAYRLNGLMQEYIKDGEDEDEKEHRLKCYKLFWDALEDTSYFEQKEQKPINSFDIVPYIDDKIAALQDMWREEKVAFDWDDLKDMIEDVARHFYHKEQKPSTGIYWHAIKKGDKIPCRAYLYKVAYETENNFGGRATIDGFLVPNIENVTCGCDTWYLPADDVKNLPREGLDELQKEQKPVEYLDKDKIYAVMTKLTNLSYSQLLPINSDEYKKIHEITSDVRSLLDCPIEQKPAEDKYQQELEATDRWQEGYEAGYNAASRPAWSEEDEKKITFLERLIRYNVPEGQYGWADGRNGGFVTKLEAISMLKSLRPSWKPSEEQMEALRNAVNKLAKTDVSDSVRLSIMYDNLKKL